MNLHPKVVASGAAGAATIMLVWILGMFGIPVPPEVASAITVLIATAAGWLKSAI